METTILVQLILYHIFLYNIFLTKCITDIYQVIHYKSENKQI